MAGSSNFVEVCLRDFESQKAEGPICKKRPPFSDNQIKRLASLASTFYSNYSPESHAALLSHLTTFKNPDIFNLSILQGQNEYYDIHQDKSLYPTTIC
jgi:hypothetical protein